MSRSLWIALRPPALGLLVLPAVAGLSALLRGEEPAVPGAAAESSELLALALRSSEERAGDYDALAARWIEAVAARGRPAGAASPPGAPEDGGRGVPDDLVLELLLRRLHEIRPYLADELALVPRLEAALRLRYPDGVDRQLVRGLLADLYRRAGREKDRAALQVGEGYLRRWVVIGPFGSGGPSQMRRPFPPERELDPAASYPGRKAPLVWRVPPRPALPPERFRPADWIYPRQGVVYLLAQLRSPARQEAVLHLGTREPVAVWVNDRPVAAEDPGESRPHRRAFGIRLASGQNRILLKTLARPQGWLWARLSDPSGEPIAGLSLDQPIQEPAGGEAKDQAPSLLVHALERGVPEPVWQGPFRSGAVPAWEAAVEGLRKKGAPPAVEADAHMGLSLLLSLGGSPERAVLHAERALELRAGDAALQAHAGHVLLAAGYLPRDHARSRARAAFEATLRLDPDHLPAYLPLARLLLEDNEPGRAAGKLAEALERRRDFLAGRLETAKLFAARDWEAEAEAAVAELAARAPRSAAPAGFRLEWYRAAGNPRRALEEVRSALELDRGRDDLLAEAAELSEETGDPAGAETALLARRALDAEDRDAAQALAAFHERRRAWDKAMEVQRELHSWNPADPAPARALGRLLERAGRPEEARAWYDRALAAEPGDIELERYRDRAAGRAARERFWADHDESLSDWLPRVPPPERFPRASALGILDIAVLKLYPDGSSSEYVHQAYRLLSEEAKEELASASTPGEVVMLRTVSADGRTLEPVPATGKSAFVMPALAPGSTVEWAYKSDHSRFEGWTVQAPPFYFQDHQYRKPFLLSRYAVILPPGLEVDLVERALRRAEGPSAAGPSAGGPAGGSPELARVKKEERELPGGGRVVVYETRDAARLEREVGMPRVEDYLPNVEILSRPGWDEVASVLEDQVLGKARVTPEIERAAAEVTAGLDQSRPPPAPDGSRQPPAASLLKARALHAYVRELVAEGRGPSEAVQVLITRSGDRTALFKALLDAAGVPNRWAFLRPRESLLPEDDGSHPRPEEFSERYVLVEEEGAPPAWVSLEVRRAPFGKLPFALQEGTALVLSRRGGGRLEPVPAQSLWESGASQRLELRLSAPDLPELGAEARLELTYSSLDAYTQKDRLRTMKEDRKKQFFSQSAARFFPGARLSSGDLPGLADPEAPLTVRLDLTAPAALVARGEEEALLRPILERLEMTKRFVQRPHREHPYRLGREVVLRDRVEVSTGPRYRFARIPRSVSQTSRLGSYSLVFTPGGPDGEGGEKLTVERVIALLPVTLSVEEFPRVVEFAKAVDRAEDERIVLARRREAAE